MNIPSILVVDDNDGDRLLAKMAIEDANVTDKIFFSVDGEEALEFLQDFDKNKNLEQEKFPPTIIFLDINMPRMNGFEFLEKYEELKSDSRYQSVVVMMLTSSVYEGDKQRSEQFPSVKEWLAKPLTGDVVREIVSTVSHGER